MIPPKLIQEMNGLMRMYAFRLSERTKVPMEIKMIDQSDIPHIVSLDEACFDDMPYDVEDLQDELSIPSFYGVVVYNAPPLATAGGMTAPLLGSGHKKITLAYIMGHHDVPLDDTPKIQAVVDCKGGYVSSTGVHPLLEGRGFFMEIYHLFEEAARMQELGYLRCHTRTHDNPEYDSKADMIQKLGFKITGRVDNWLDAGDHFYEMVKKLEPKKGGEF